MEKIDCPKCDGTGQYLHYGICFACMGTGEMATAKDGIVSFVGKTYSASDELPFTTTASKPGILLVSHFFQYGSGDMMKPIPDGNYIVRDIAFYGTNLQTGKQSHYPLHLAIRVLNKKTNANG